MFTFIHISLIRAILTLGFLLALLFSYAGIPARGSEKSEDLNSPALSEDGMPNAHRQSDRKAYLLVVKRKIYRKWFPPKDVDKSIQVQFFIHRDGHISGLKVTRSSGLSYIDHAALEAVKQAAPFDTLPPQFEEPQQIVFNFDTALTHSNDIKTIFSRFHR